MENKKDLMKIWFDPEKKVVAFFDENHRCLDIYLKEKTLKAGLYDGDELVQEGPLISAEISFEDVKVVLRNKSLNPILGK